jgi:hypothetical protein
MPSGKNERLITATCFEQFNMTLIDICKKTTYSTRPREVLRSVVAMMARRLSGVAKPHVVIIQGSQPLQRSPISLGSG